tara:strand:- start:43621 stop:44976 length:1356 start_codon:yes stop_codon:yes gene_type:complete
MFDSVKKILSLKKPKLMTVEEKSALGGSIFFDTKGRAFSYVNSALQYFSYYSYVAPVGDAINKIANSSCSIKIMPYSKGDKQSYKVVIDNPFFKKLQNPNPQQTRSDFFKDFYIDYLVSGNHYLYVSVNFKNEILELHNLCPTAICVEENAFGNISRYTYNKNHTGVEMSFSKESVKIHGKTYELFKERNKNAYLFHFKEPSKNPKFTKSFGDSKLQSVQLEAEQYLEASRYNTNVILNGFNAKILLSPKEELRMTSDQHAKVKEELSNFYSGSNNSGNNVMLPKIPMTAQFIGYNSKDMDFKELMQRMRVAVYNCNNIPLPMVEGEYTSNANMKESDLQFYDKAVIPLIDVTSERLFKIYDIFYDDNTIVKFDFDKSAIPALQERMIKNAVDLTKTGAITKNENREYLGLGRVEGGADALFIDGNSIPIAGDISFVNSLSTTIRDITTAN